MKTQLILTVFFLFSFSSLFTQNTYIVNSTANFQDANPGDGICDNGNGACTLRAAMEESNADNVASIIHFNILGTGPHFINLPATNFNPLPAIIEFNPLIIDATTQPGNNPTNGQIILQGNNNNENGFEIFTTALVEIYGVQVQFCNTGITSFMTSGDINLIAGSTDKGNILVDNLTGIGMFVNGNVTAEGNLIGTDLTGADRGNGEVGVSLSEVFMGGLTATIKDNTINFNNTGVSCAGFITVNNNIIGANDSRGIEIFNTTTTPITVSQNSIFCNPTPIFVDNNPSPNFTLTSASTTQVSGNTTSNGLVELFIHDDTGCSGITCQGRTFIISGFADPSGLFTITGNFPANAQITGTSTDGLGRTSPFSNCITVDPPNCSVEIQYSSAQNPGFNAGNLAQDCPGNLITLFAIPDPAGNYDADWTYPSGATDCCTNGSITATEEGQYTLTVTETATGCMSTDVITVNYFNQPSVSITTSPTNTFCSDDNINATLTASANFASYDWSNGEGTQSINVTTTGDFTVTATDSNGCFDTATETISQLPPVAVDVCVSLNGGTLICDAVVTACPGDLIEISAVDGNGNIGGFDFYTWSNGQSGTSIPTITVTNADKYEVIVTEGNCKGIETVEIVFANPTAAVPSDFSVCEGQNIQLQEFGGDAVQWNWSGPNSFVSFSQNPVIMGATSVNQGTYFVTITDINGCTDTDNLVVTVNPAPTAIISGMPTNVCEGESVTLNFDFTGTGPFTFVYSINGASQPAITINDNFHSIIETPSQNTDYELVSVSDNTNCNGMVSGIVNVTVTPFPTANPASLSVCDNGTGNGDFDLTLAENTVNGGSGLPVSWYEDDALAMPITNPISYVSSDGTVFATVTDNGCESQPANVILTVLTISLTNCADLTPVSMVGGSDGVATIDISGNSEPYNYSLSPGGMTGVFSTNGNHTISGLAADTYTLTADNNSNCTSECTFTITEPDCSNFSVILDGMDVNCFGGNNGAITSTVTSGSGDYNFDWANPAINGIQNPNGLTAGGYSLTLTDNVTGCITTNSVTINEPISGVTATISNSQNVDCFGNMNGSATVAATGGTVASDYSYNWSNGEMTAINNNLTAQIYTVTVTDDNGCSAITSVEITQPNELIVSVSTTDETAFNANDGTATANHTGGTMPFFYTWSNSMFTPTINNLQPADYFVTVTDGNDCTATASGTVNPFICTPITILIDKNDVTCNGFDDGDATATATGDNPPFTFDWSNGVTNNNMIANLPPGTYTVTATDATNCEETAQVTILEPALLTVSISKTDETANNANDGTATANPAGGTPPISYIWSNGETSQTISDLQPDDYFVTVTDANNCTATAAVTILPFGCTPISILIDKNDVTCNGFDDGDATATATGVNPPFTFDWSNGVMNNSMISNLPPGTYTVTVTDAANCQEIAQVTILEPALLTVSISKTDETANNANDGTATAIPVGGTPPISYIWSNGETSQTISDLQPDDYFVTVTDANNCTATAAVTILPFGCTPISILIDKNDVTCNGFDDGDATATATGDNPPFTFDWSNGVMNNSMISNLPPGTYTVTVTDAANCQEIAQVTILEPALLTVSISKTDETANNANDGTATAIPAGGTPPISFIWSNGETSQTISNLPPDDYSVTITDANNCTATAAVTINPVGCEFINASLLVENITCFDENDGMATASANGQNPPFSFNWSNGQTGNNIQNLPPDNYSLTVTDNANCDTILNFVIIEPDLLTVAISKTDETANNANDGTATAIPAGGTPPISYNWSNGETSQTISNLPPDDYFVTITDANNCTATATVTINPVGCGLFNVNLQTMDVTSFGGNNGAATATAAGDSPPFSFNWSTGSANASINNLIAGNYSLTVSDNANCDTIWNFEIIEPDTFVVIIDVTDESANNANDGKATANPSGGVPPYSFEWTTGETSTTICDLPPGNIGVTVTDSNGNIVNGSATINPFGCGLFNVNLQTMDVTSFGGNNGAATATAAGDSPPFSFNWSTGSANTSINNLIAGNYSLTVSDNANCDTILNFEIIEPDTFVVIIDVTDESANNANDGKATATASGGVPPYSFEWTTGETSTTICDLPPGNVGVTVTDSNGNIATSSANINAFGCDDIIISSQKSDVTCFGLGDGMASASATGGIDPYSFSWSNGVQNNSIDNLFPGIYFVTVLDAANCSAIDTIEILEPELLEISVTSTDVTTVNGNDGSATVNINGGTSNFSILWENGETTETITDLTAGTYGVTVTDENGCTDTGIATINEPNSTINLSLSTQMITCNGGNDGAATVTATDGIEPYTYLWDNGETTPTITNLGAGNYSVEVMDASGNSQFAGVTISQPSPLVMSFAILAQTCEGEMTGSAEVMAFGGTEPHNFLWENGQTDPIVTSLPAGEISVTVTDANGCSATSIIDIPEIAIPTADLQGNFEICEGESWNLPVILSGNPPFELIYMAGNQEITVSSNSTFFPLNVTPAETTVYTLVSISDENGCLNDNLNGTATVTLNNIPIIQNVVETAAADTYTVSFEVINSTQFSVSGNASTINGNMVTSAPIPCGTDYNFTITNNCGSADTSGMVNCQANCLTDAGSLDLTQITVCEGLTISAIHNSDQSLDLGDLLQFALLSENGSFPFNILAIQDNPDFENINAGNYQILAIAGENDGSGTINLGDPCLDISEVVQVIVLERPFEPISLQWQDTLCSGSDLVLVTDTYPFGTDYHWILPNGDETTTSIPTLTIFDASASDQGFYNVYVGIGDCVSEPFEEAGFVNIIDVGVMNDTIPACGEDQALLEAANIDFGIGVWSNTSTNAIIAEPLNSTTLVNNLAVGENMFIWTVASDLCNLSDTSWVFFNPEVVVNNDSFIMEATSLTLAFDPFQNDGLDDFDDSDIDISIISEPAFGELSMNDGLMEYTREDELEGDVFITYEICSQSPLEACESACDTATIKITVYFDPNIPLASRGVTPNNDGANDIWKILNIHQNPNNQVVITNRWGDVIFQRTGYRNEEGNAWDGRYNGNILPQGAYYFVIETNPGGEENVVLTGTVYLIL